jgi:hypothetical protein
LQILGLPRLKVQRDRILNRRNIGATIITHPSIKQKPMTNLSFSHWMTQRWLNTKKKRYFAKENEIYASKHFLDKKKKCWRLMFLTFFLVASWFFKFTFFVRGDQSYCHNLFKLTWFLWITLNHFESLWIHSKLTSRHATQSFEKKKKS